MLSSVLGMSGKDAESASSSSGGVESLVSAVDAKFKLTTGCKYLASSSYKLAEASTANVEKAMGALSPTVKGGAPKWAHFAPAIAKSSDAAFVDVASASERTPPADEAPLAKAESNGGGLTRRNMQIVVPEAEVVPEGEREVVVNFGEASLV